MAFCKLPDSQIAALFFLESIAAAPPGKFANLKTAVANQKWDAVAGVAELISGSAPSAADFQAVGTMPQGVQNAFFTLAIVDAKGTDDAKANLAKALDTHCWDKIADQIVSSISKTGITFSGADLHQAYAPNDASSCQGPTGFELAIGKMIAAGQLVGTFFSSSLPDFFEHDFTNFFTGTVAGFFTGPVAGFFTDFGGAMAGGFESLGSTLESGLAGMGSTIGKGLGHLDPTSW